LERISFQPKITGSKTQRNKRFQSISQANWLKEKSVKINSSVEKKRTRKKSAIKGKSP